VRDTAALVRLFMKLRDGVLGRSAFRRHYARLCPSRAVNGYDARVRGASPMFDAVALL